jgi:hypothetical protein
VARFSALLDACVLVPPGRRLQSSRPGVRADTLLRLAEADLYRPLWSAKILDEMITAIETIHPDLAGGPADRRAAAMNEAFEDACVTGWELIATGISLPDANDRHVVAAAQRGRADLIVTANLKDFPPRTLGALGVEVQSPDDFLLNQLDLDGDRVIDVLHNQAAATKHPVMTFNALLNNLGRCGVPEFAQAAAQHKWRYDQFPT